MMEKKKINCNSFTNVIRNGLSYCSLVFWNFLLSTFLSFSILVKQAILILINDCLAWKKKRNIRSIFSTGHWTHTGSFIIFFHPLHQYIETRVHTLIGIGDTMAMVRVGVPIDQWSKCDNHIIKIDRSSSSSYSIFVDIFFLSVVCIEYIQNIYNTYDTIQIE